MPLSMKDTMWLSCREKSCCSFYIVFPAGVDIWRIATALQVPPWSFTTMVPAPQEALDGFKLARSGRRFRAALAKAPGPGNDAAPCVFLMHAADGSARCGLGDLRPSPCHSFPSVLISRVLYLMNDGGCTCRSWSLSDVDIEEETVVVSREMRAKATYHKVIAHWNEYVDRVAGEEIFSFADFCRYLLDVYTQLSADGHGK